jgi:5-formyltetrahydrofolate cyclo-ligase
MQTNAYLKDELRNQAKAKVLNLISNRSDFYERQAHLINQIELSSFFKKAKTILSYYPLGDEFDLSSMIISNTDKRWVLPRPIGNGIMLLFEVFELHELKETRFFIKSPPATNPLVNPKDIDLVIIPALGFDNEGYRLGRGGGYYDRLLPKLSSKAKTIGVIASELMINKLPREAHDKPVDKVFVS